MQKMIIDTNYFADADEICQAYMQHNGLLIYLKSGDTHLFKNVKVDIIDYLTNFLFSAKFGNIDGRFDVRDYRLVNVEDSVITSKDIQKG